MRIEALELLADDLDAQRAFYDRLGFRTRLDESLRILVGASELVFRHEPGFRGIYHFAFDVPFGRIGAAEEFLGQVGVAPLEDDGGATRFHFESWDAEAVYFRDAADNIVEFIGRREIASEADRFQVLNVSEIGVACLHVPSVAEMLGSQLGIAGYRNTSPDFFPLGDAEGLLILAQTGRKWYPDTGIPAQELPFSATIRAGTGLWSICGAGSTVSAERVGE